MTLRAGLITIGAVAALLALDSVAWDSRYRAIAWQQIEQSGAKLNDQIRHFLNKAMR
jgi:hypothetical protein